MTAKCTRIRNTLAGLIASCLAASAGAAEAAEQAQVTYHDWTTGDCGSGEFKMGSYAKKYYIAGIPGPLYETQQRCARAQFGGKDVKLVTKDLDHTKYNLCPVNQFIVGVMVDTRPRLECAEVYDSENRRLFITPQGHWRNAVRIGGTVDRPEVSLQCPDNQVAIAFQWHKFLDDSRIGCGTVQYQK